VTLFLLLFSAQAMAVR
jgi:hypothetical protein